MKINKMIVCKRTILIILAIDIILASVLAGAIANYTQIINDKNSAISSKKDQVETLTNEINQLQNQITEINMITSNLRLETVSLQQKMGCLQLSGLCYGPFRDGQDPQVGLFPNVFQITEDIEVLKNITNRIRTYGSTNTLATIPSLAKQFGLQVYHGISLGKDREINEAEINSTINLAKQKLLDSVIVGNEVMLMNMLSEAELTEYIRTVKQNLPEGIPLTTAEFWTTWMDHPDLVQEVDYILAHIHPFWENQTIEKAATYVIEKYQILKAQYPNKRIVIGETGWPSAGDPNWTGISLGIIPSEENQQRFLAEFTQLAARDSIEYFLFDAFDEEWKWREGQNSGTEQVAEPMDRTFSGHMPGSSWGIFQSNGELKSKLSEFFKAILTQTPLNSTRKIRDIYIGERLSNGYDMGVNSSKGMTNWLSDMNGSMRMMYPGGQDWGAVFITVGKPVDLLLRSWKDFSAFRIISIELKGQVGGESVELGIKDAYDPDNGRETKNEISNLSRDWQTFEFSLSSFQTAELEELYVVAEFVFTGSKAQTVYFQNIQYLP